MTIATAPTPAPTTPPGQRLIVSALYVSVMFVTILDSTAVNVSLTAIARDFGSGLGSIEWVVTSYLLGLACTVPLAGWLAGRIGMKRLFLIGLACFTASSAACAIADTLPTLIAARAVQGLAGGVLTPLGLAMLFRVYPPAERARASKILLIPTAVAPAVGPLLGGWLTEHHSWHWVFSINIPIGIAVIAIGARWLAPEISSSGAGAPALPTRLDWSGALLIAGGLAAVLYALGEGARSGWSAQVVAIAVVGAGALALYLDRSRRSTAPVLDLTTLQDRLFRSTTVVMCASTGAFLGVLFVLPQYLQRTRGLSPFEAGTTTFVEALGVIASSQLVGRLYPTVGPRRIMAAGMATMALWLTVFSATLPHLDLWGVRALMFAIGTSYGLVLVPLQAASFARISPDRMSQASSLFNTVRQIAAATGVAIMAATITATAGGAGHRWALAAAAVIALVGAVTALAINDEDAASTMVPRRAR